MELPQHPVSGDLSWTSKRLQIYGLWSEKRKVEMGRGSSGPQDCPLGALSGAVVKEDTLSSILQAW